jgi:hypothetical protein
MSLNGLNPIGIGGGALNLPSRTQRTGAGEGNRPAATSLPTTPRGPEMTQSPAGGVPAEPPAGTDPALWAVLTGEERSFFARYQSLGPLTYGPKTPSPAQGIARGGRLDITV